jgi:hypothetical protein
MNKKNEFEDVEEEDDYIHPDGPLPPLGPEPNFLDNRFQRF